MMKKLVSFKGRESRHCEEPRRSLCVGGQRGNPQKWFFLKKTYLLSKLCLVYGLLCRFAPRNDEYVINSVISRLSLLKVN